MSKYIQSEQLSVDDLPRKYARWSKIVEFASTYDIAVESQDGAKIFGLSDLTESPTVQKKIREALYCEWRRYNYRSSGPEQEIEKLAWVAIESLRSKLSGDDNKLPLFAATRLGQPTLRFGCAKERRYEYL